MATNAHKSETSDVRSTEAKETLPRPQSTGRYVRRFKAAEHLQNHWGLPTTTQALAKLAHVGGGPPVQYFGRWPLYQITGLDEWAESKISAPVASTSELKRPAICGGHETKATRRGLSCSRPTRQKG